MMIKKITIISLLAFIFTFVLYKALDLGLIWFVYPSEEKYPIRGIDVSNHQGKLNGSLTQLSNVK